MRQRFAYAVTFEFDRAAPETVRGTVVAGTGYTAARKAAKAASGAVPGRRWRSVVILLERLGTEAGAAASDAAVAQDAQGAA